MSDQDARRVWRKTRRAGSGRSVGSRPAPAYTGLTQTPFTSMLTGGSKLFTVRGFIEARELADVGIIQVWTGATWAAATVTPSSHRHKTVAVVLSNGFTVVCGTEQTWACMDETTRTPFHTPASKLAPGHQVFPFNYPDTPYEARCQTAYREGWALARGHPPSNMPKGFLTRRAEDVLDIAAGLSDAQGGHLLVSKGGVRSLVMGLAQAGVGPALAVPTGPGIYEVLIPRTFKEFFSEAQCVSDINRPVRVREVRSGPTQRCYRVVLLPPDGDEHYVSAPKSVVVDMALLLAPHAQADCGESQSSLSSYGTDDECPVRQMSSV